MELSSIFKSIAAEAVEHVRRANTADRLRAGSQLFVLQPDHWLFPLLCQFKRQRRQAHLVEMQRQRHNMSLDKTKHKLLGKLLPQHEPFLVELTFVHCVHAWPENGGSDIDFWGFDAFLRRELDSTLAKAWFDCQFFLDQCDLLMLAPLLFKEQRIALPSALCDVIALCVAESSDGTSSCASLLIEKLAMAENKAALDAWMVWVAETFVTMAGSLPEPRDVSATSLHFMSQYVMNPTQLEPSKRAYIANGVQNPNFVTRDFVNLRGEIVNRKASESERRTSGPCIYVGATE